MRWHKTTWGDIKMNKDVIYKFLTNLDKESFADLLAESNFETDNLDFKETWIKKGPLTKELLSMANSGGGIIVFGVKETAPNTFESCGLQETQDPSKIQDSVKKFVPSNLGYKIESFTFDRSEYEKLQGKSFQVIIVEDTPQYLPYISKNETEGLKGATIYVRHGTECVIADKDDIENLITRRISTGYRSKLELEEHLKQLKTLYKYKSPQQISISSVIVSVSKFLAQNYYGENSEFSSYIDSLIERKKKIIEMDLGF